MINETSDISEPVLCQSGVFDPMKAHFDCDEDAQEYTSNQTTEERFARLDQKLRDGLRAFADAGFAFLEIREKELWRAGNYKSWDDYCKSILETTRSYINRLIGHAMIYQELMESKPPCDCNGEKVLPVAEFQSRPLKKLSDRKKRIKAWKIAVKRAGGLPTAKIVMEVVAELIGDSPEKVHPSRGAQRLELIKSLREAAHSRDSWERVDALIKLLEKLESGKTHIQ